MTPLALIALIALIVAIAATKQRANSPTSGVPTLERASRHEVDAPQGLPLGTVAGPANGQPSRPRGFAGRNPARCESGQTSWASSKSTPCRRSGASGAVSY